MISIRFSWYKNRFGHWELKTTFFEDMFLGQTEIRPRIDITRKKQYFVPCLKSQIFKTIKDAKKAVEDKYSIKG